MVRLEDIRLIEECEWGEFEHRIKNNILYCRVFPSSVRNAWTPMTEDSKDYASIANRIYDIFYKALIAELS